MAASPQHLEQHASVCQEPLPAELEPDAADGRQLTETLPCDAQTADCTPLGSLQPVSSNRGIGLQTRAHVVSRQPKACDCLPTHLQGGGESRPGCL